MGVVIGSDKFFAGLLAADVCCCGRCSCCGDVFWPQFSNGKNFQLPGRCAS